MTMELHGEVSLSPSPRLPNLEDEIVTPLVLRARLAPRFRPNKNF